MSAAMDTTTHRRRILHYLSTQCNDSSTKAIGEQFTLSRPHSCHHCARKTVSGGEYGKKASLEGFSDEITFVMDYHLLGAVEAAQAGCALYQWLLNLVWRYHKNQRFNISLEDVADAEFTLKFLSVGGMTAHPVIRITTVGGDERIIDQSLIKDWLVVSAHEGICSPNMQSWSPRRPSG